MFHVKHPPTCADEPSPPALRHLDEALARLKRDDLYRSPTDESGTPALRSLCSNDYLGFGSAPIPVRPDLPTGVGASRLVTPGDGGAGPLERTVAAFVGAPAALTFTSGYAANVGLLSALLSPADVVVSDALNHASLIDGIRLARSQVRVVPHLSLPAVAEALRVPGPAGGRRWVVTESYFSMDGDGPDLRKLRELCDDAGAGLVVDEAHALGTLGPEGRGRCAEAGVVADALVGTFGKAFGAQGAFVAGSSTLRAWLWNRARSFVFSTGLSPAVAEAARLNLLRSLAEPQHRQRLGEVSRQLRDVLSQGGLEPLGWGPIVPCVIGSAAQALACAQSLREAGFHVQAIRPPTVPEGTARLRFTASSSYRSDDLTGLAQALRRRR